MAPRLTKFNTNWCKEFNFIKPIADNQSKALCEICGSIFNISNGGKSDIVSHTKSKVHERGKRTILINHNIKDFMQLAVSDDKLKVVAKELAYSYHSARHNISLRSNDCNTKLVKVLFEPSYSCSRTKTGAYIRNVISPFIDEEIKTSLLDLHFLTVITDTSNRKAEKLLPVIVRGFSKLNGVVHYLLSIKTIPNERSQTISMELFETGV